MVILARNNCGFLCSMTCAAYSVLLAMDPMQQNLVSQPVEHNYCEMSGLCMDQKYVPFFQSDLTEVMHVEKPNCSVRFSDEEGMIFSGPPQEISEAYNMAMDFICKCLQLDEVQLLRTTTTTNDYYHELRVTNYDEHEIRLRRNTITTTPVGVSPPSDFC